MRDNNIWKVKIKLSMFILLKEITLRNSNTNGYKGGIYELGINLFSNS